ncbi:MAG: UDP-N-acetylglucosamine--N-acetylmuramyl-(pentapeptide) pyrophosphoryl-undecaprenol N-acetylglucosamine transferase [Spirochaetales bacterium]|nr:UDP-N-acetylglucosamine--N-acetylmuramyl-(pentapeptide) pyrophosphoryl-undecaprenol N-acetylglucosamine transferase [Spirochaetales bacterium]
MKYLVFTGGGTGGHVFPGLAVAEKLANEPDLDIIWLGSEKGIERDLVENSGIPNLEFRPIPAGKLRRYLSFQNLTDLFRILGAFVVCLNIFMKVKPLGLFSKGGFVTVPPVWAAGLLGIKVFSHESDFDPGLATKLNLGFSSKVFVAYQETLESLSPRHRNKTVVTGNPIRSQILAGRPEDVEAFFSGLKTPSVRPLILVLGGSLGAVQLNDLVVSVLNSLRGRAVVVHQHGTQWQAPEPEEGFYYPRAFLGPELPSLLAAADFALARAGAGTLWELAAWKIPSLLIPLTAGSRGDQVRNARYFEKLGAVKVLLDPGVDEFRTMVEEFLKSDFRQSLRQRYTRLPLDPSEGIASIIRKEIRR